MSNIKKIINTLLLQLEKETEVRDETLDEEITHAFRNWKNSKVYK